jgi:hypothetical protein
MGVMKLLSYYSDCVTVCIEEVQSGGKVREVEGDGRDLGGECAYLRADYAVEAYRCAGCQAGDGQTAVGRVRVGH